ncbi:MAG: glutamate-5-semialdehyde dehydrogenase [Parvularculaceae bacterium]
MGTVDDKIGAYVSGLGRNARAAARELAVASTQTKTAALAAAAAALRERRADIVAANAKDIEKARADGKTDAFVDRLALTDERVNAIAGAVEEIVALPDPVGRALSETTRPNGLKITKVATPLGVIGMVYESRPNVGADAGALCVKSGNAVIQRGGSDSANSSRLIIECMRAGLKSADLPADAIQYVDTTDRAAVAELLRCDEYVDLVIPRGGRGLVELVRDQARVPTLLHLDGNCHTYVHEDADLDKAAEIVANAKLRRTGVCGATESLVVDEKIAGDALPRLVDALEGCEIRGDAAAVAIDGRVKPASDDDWATEYLDAVVSVKVVKNLDAALDHVAAYSSAHTDAIVTENDAAAERFLATIDSAVVMRNASTQFSDGGEFGMGAEIGIATGKMHARGPVGLEQLTSFKYQVRGDGQVRP